ncbi:MAG: tRNA (adenosine(37)-N6)-threonylcarbamoyltransferase complex ATPase subunit type 1 TsaE [Anaerotignum sp.]|nr:tRNA (adenosine(37)-N6)-threonylcarbamoyltransferase complex ATPase subunit type 1 TsaE [Anaerotignum sp.]
MEEKIESFAPNETEAFGEKLGQAAQPGQIYCLSGDLGVGKTVFTKGFAKGLGVTEVVTSPTFTILNEYPGRLPLYHFDVYRISDEEEMDDTGYEDYFYGQGVCLVEWAELIENLIPQNAIWITVEKDYTKSEDYRRITLRQGAEEA